MAPVTAYGRPLARSRCSKPPKQPPVLAGGLALGCVVRATLGLGRDATDEKLMIVIEGA